MDGALELLDKIGKILDEEYTDAETVALINEWYRAYEFSYELVLVKRKPTDPSA